MFSRPYNRLTQISPERLMRALPDHINVYSALYVHTWLNQLTDSCPDRTSTYPALHGLTVAELPYPILSRSDFYLPDRTWPPYPSSLSDRVTLR
jgi:hypothetical protein